MKKKFLKQIVCVFMVIAMTITIIPENLLSVQAAEPLWQHMSDVEAATGYASYDLESDTISFGLTGDFSGRMNYVGIADVSGKDYAIEFDLKAEGGALGVYNYEDSGELFGVYMDMGAGLLDNVHVQNGAFKRNFWSQDNNTTIGDGIVYFDNGSWSGTTDMAGCRIRVEYIRGAGGTLSGGTVNYYKMDSATEKYVFMASMAIPEDVADDPDLKNHFGIQMWSGKGSVSNITVSEFNATPAWVHMSDVEEATGYASYDRVNDTISFGLTGDFSGRMNYVGIADVSGKDYAIEFDLKAEGGALGVYNYEDSGELFGVYMDMGAGLLDNVHVQNGAFKRNFWSQDNNTTNGDGIVYFESGSWDATSDMAGCHIRVEVLRGNEGTLAGGSMNYYKKDDVTGKYQRLARFAIPTDVIEDPDSTNHLGIQMWSGTGSVSNIIVSEYEPSKLPVGGGDSNTEAVYVSVDDGDSLPIATYVEGKYIIGWTIDGQNVTTFDKEIDADKYVAEFIDTKMLSVKKQDGTVTNEGTENAKKNVRFIASVNDLDYETAGFAISLKNSKPEVGGSNCTHKGTTIVYKALNADGESQKVDVVYPGGYSTHMYALEILNIPAYDVGTTIYIRAYVELPDGKYVYGDVREVQVTENGDGVLTSTGFSMESYAVGDNYGMRIINPQGEVVSEQNAPVILRVKKDTPSGDTTGSSSTQEIISTHYQDVKVTKGSLTATAEVSSTAGSKFAITDVYSINSEGGFILSRDIDVMVAAEEDDGFNSIVEYREKTPGTYDQYEYFIPSTVIRNNDHIMSGAIGYDLSQSFVLARDSQTGLPMVMLKNKNNNYAFSMGRIIDGKVTSGVDESSNNWIVDADLDYGSTGLSNTSGTTSAVLWYPGVGTNSTGSVERSHPIQAGVEHCYDVLLLPMQEENFTDAMVTAYKTQYAVNKDNGGVPDKDADLNSVYNATMDLLDTNTKQYNGTDYGMPFAMTLDGNVLTVDGYKQTDYLMGFIGQQTSVGYQLIRSGLKTGKTEQLTKGVSIVDFWATESFTEYGFPCVAYVTRNSEWVSSSGLQNFLRYTSDGMEGILDAYLLMRNVGDTRDSWLEACKTYANWLVSIQNTDGSFPRAYNQDTGKVADTDKHTTSCNIRYLVRMYEQTQDAAYLNAAIAAGNYVYNTNYVADSYHGGCPDGFNVLDKESAIMALYGFSSLYQVTGETKWLNAAEHAAICAASFIYTFDFNVTGEGSYNIYNTVGTSGLSRISTGNWGSDPFAAYLYYEYFKLYVYTGDTFYYNFAELLQDNTKQFMNINGSIPVYGANGLVNEAVAIANMWYEDDVEAYLPWISIAMLDPIGTMESAFTVQTIEEANEFERSTLLNLLTDYGAGGKFKR